MIIPAEPMNYTGERMVPEAADPRTFWEHIYRYRFAAGYVAGLRVLDIACGEGYGSAALLKAGAKSLVGVDISTEACTHAARKYGIDARTGSAMDIPLADNSVDAVISFETVEHVADPTRFVAECKRVLVPNGLLVISTPNRDVYHHIAPNNPFHCSELDENEFKDLLSPHFQEIGMYQQCLSRAAWWNPRGVIADKWLWSEIRGPRRLVRVLRRYLCPSLRNEDQSRLSPWEAILRAETSFSQLANPFIVRRGQAGQNRLFMYLIATARSQKGTLPD